MNSRILISLLKNWRTYALLFMGLISAVLIFGETETLGIKIAGVAAAVFILYLIRAFYRFWRMDDQIEDVNKIFKDEK